MRRYLKSKNNIEPDFSRSFQTTKFSFFSLSNQADEQSEIILTSLHFYPQNLNNPPISIKALLDICHSHPFEALDMIKSLIDVNQEVFLLEDCDTEVTIQFLDFIALIYYCSPGYGGVRFKKYNNCQIYQNVLNWLGKKWPADCINRTRLCGEFVLISEFRSSIISEIKEFSDRYYCQLKRKYIKDKLILGQDITDYVDLQHLRRKSILRYDMCKRYSAPPSCAIPQMPYPHLLLVNPGDYLYSTNNINTEINENNKSKTDAFHSSSQTPPITHSHEPKLHYHTAAYNKTQKYYKCPSMPGEEKDDNSVSKPSHNYVNIQLINQQSGKKQVSFKEVDETTVNIQQCTSVAKSNSVAGSSRNYVNIQDLKCSSSSIRYTKESSDGETGSILPQNHSTTLSDVNYAKIILIKNNTVI